MWDFLALNIYGEPSKGSDFEDMGTWYSVSIYAQLESNSSV